MSLRTRRIIAFIFIAGFLISAPILILYTAGYRYSFKKNEIQKAGALFIETEPKNASIYIGNELQKNGTPAQITNLFPNHYKIRIEKDNYFNWEKELEIKTQNTTFAENIELFKNQQSENVSNDKNILKLHQAKGCILFQSVSERNTNFECLTPDNNESTVAASIAGANAELIDQSENNKKFLVKLADQSYQIFSSENSYQQILTDLPKQIETIKWDEDNEHFLYFSNDTEIWQINLLGKNPVYSKIAALDEPIIDFAIKGDKLYTISPSNGKNIFSRRKLQAPNKIDNSIELPSSKFAIDSFFDDYIVLIDTGKEDIYIISDDLKQTKLKIEGNNKYTYLADNEMLIIYNEFEIFTVNLKDEISQPNLLIRYSTKIDKIIWFNDNYIIALHDSKIKIIELDNRDQRIIYELNTDGKKVDEFWLDKDKENIFYLAENSVWKLNVK